MVLALLCIDFLGTTKLFGVFVMAFLKMFSAQNINRLLTEREGRTGEYWPEGQYSPVRPEQAWLVSCLLYGTLFLIVKCTSAAINLFSFLSFQSF